MNRKLFGAVPLKGHLLQSSCYKPPWFILEFIQSTALTGRIEDWILFLELRGLEKRNVTGCIVRGTAAKSGSVYTFGNYKFVPPCSLSSVIEMHHFTLTSLMKVCHDGKTVGKHFFSNANYLAERNNKGRNCHQGEEIKSCSTSLGIVVTRN